MPGGFDIAMEHICSDPFLDFVDYGRLAATSRFGAYTVSLCTAVAELRRLQAAATMQCGFDLAMKRICRDPFLDFVDYGRLVATSRFGADTVSDGMFGVSFYGLSDYNDSSSESETTTAVWMLTSTHRAYSLS